MMEGKTQKGGMGRSEDPQPPHTPWELALTGTLCVYASLRLHGVRG